MRLLGRNAPVDELPGAVNGADAPRLDRVGVPPKAQKLLGAKGQLGLNIEESIIISGGGGSLSNGIHVPPKAQKVLGEKSGVQNSNTARSRDAKHADPESLCSVREAERKGISHVDLASIADSDTVPGAKPLPAVPVAMRSSEDVRQSSTNSTPRTATASRYAGHQDSRESMRDAYYDAAKEPLYVSQQTSESSLRDLALRKGDSALYDGPSNGSVRPGSNSSRMPDRSVSDGPKTARKAGLRTFLSHGRPSLRPATGGKPSRPSPEAGDSSEYFARDTKHVHLTRKGSRLRVEAGQSKRLPSDPGSGRVQILEPDMYNSVKTNVYRPPKGSKNWFDGFDISSDEEEQEPVELPAAEMAPRSVLAVQEALPSVFSLYGPPTRDFTPPIEGRPVTTLLHKAQPAHITKEAAARAKFRKNSQGSAAADSVSSGAVEGRKRATESRLARSRLGSHSVLSLSSGSDQDSRQRPRTRESVGQSTVTNGKSASLDIQRPAAGPSSEGYSLEPVANADGLRRSNSHSTGMPSNPFRDNQTTYNSTPRVPSHGSMLSRSSSDHRRAMNGAFDSPRFRPGTRLSYDRDGGESGCDETTSSVPTDASRLMAVTEEEMMLLELMRQKRAAMQKHSFAEGYRLARRQGEHQHFDPRRHAPTMRDPMLVALKKRTSAGSSRVTSRGLSRTESLIREELEQRRRLSALRKEDVDRAFKMDRFFEMEPLPGEERDPRVAKFFAMAPGLADEFGDRPISGTEIEIGSQFDEDETTGEEGVGEDANPEFDEAGDFQRHREESVEPGSAERESESRNTQKGETNSTPDAKETAKLSPMQRLTDLIPPAPARTPPQDASSEENRHERVQAYVESTADSRAALGPVTVPATENAEAVEEISKNQESVPSERETDKEEPTTEEEGAKSAEDGRATQDEETTSSPSERHKTNGIRTFHSLHINTQTSSSSEAVSPMPVDSPDTPVATTWARSTSLRHPRPQRQAAKLDFSPLEQHPVRPRPASIGTSIASPLSSSFESPIRSPAAVSPEGDKTAGAGDASGATHVFATAVPQPLKSHPPGRDMARPRRVPVPPPKLEIAGLAQHADVKARVTSMASITSAGEDVLAAWAELGGGSEFRRQKNW